MAYFPVFIQLEGKRCLVAGGGRVALRKCRILAGFGARVLVVAREACRELKDFSEESPAVELLCRKARAEDADGMDLVVCAVDDKAFCKGLAEYCRKRHIPVNTADGEGGSTFFFPAIVRQEDMVIGISTGGKSPAAARYLRQRLEECLPRHLGKLIDRLGSFRLLVKKSLSKQQDREKAFARLLQIGLSREGEIPREAVDEVLKKVREQPPEGKRTKRNGRTDSDRNQGQQAVPGAGNVSDPGHRKSLPGQQAPAGLPENGR